MARTLVARTWLRSIVCVMCLVGLAFGMRSLAQSVGQAGGSNEPVKLTNQEDRQRMMDQLKITMFPSGPGAYLASTYDEATANPYPKLPDPLVMNNGTKVTTPAQWKARRAEILELFDREVYGRRPKVMPKVRWEVVSTTTGTTDTGVTLAGAANPRTGSAVITKQLIGHVDNSAYPAITVNIQASLSTPANAKGRVPVVLMFGGGGPPAPGAPAQPNPCALPGAPARGVPPAAVAGSGVAAAGRAVGRAGAPGGATPEPSAQEQIIRHGWGYATINSGSVQADCGAGLTVGIIGLVNNGQPR